MPTTSDVYLKGLLARDTAVVQSIYTEFAPRIEAMVTKNGGNQEDARDVFQEGLLIIWRKAQGPEFELTSGFYTFLYGICINLWRRKRKKKDNNTVTIADVKGLISETDIQNDLETSERHQVFRQHFLILGLECQKLLTLFFGGTPMKKIAKLLNIENDHAARNRKYRCQKKLEDSIMKDPRLKEISLRP
jgi:RNA polymerase sigma factor (sigma-70 family)